MKDSHTSSDSAHFTDGMLLKFLTAQRHFVFPAGDSTCQAQNMQEKRAKK